MKRVWVLLASALCAAGVAAQGVPAWTQQRSVDDPGTTVVSPQVVPRFDSRESLESMPRLTQVSTRRAEPSREERKADKQARRAEKRAVSLEKRARKDQERARRERARARKLH